jgi:alkylation response protein AidB-like acyl-CoA dehydrogenase
VQLTFDSDVEEFRAEFAAFVDEHLPTAAETLERPRSVSHMPEWARRWQRLLFDNGWLLPGQPPEFGGRNATVLQQYVHLEELCRRRIYHSFNPQGVNIVAASLITFGTDEQKRRWAVPILRAEITASLGMSEPSAGSDLASLRTRAVLDGDHFVVNGQKVWTSGAHDADVLLTFVRTDPDAPIPKALSAGPSRPSAVRTTSTSTRCSSPTPGYPPKTWSARSTRAGGWPTDHSDTSAR